MSSEVTAEICLVWDAFYRSHYWVLRGTLSVLDGAVLAVPNDHRPLREQARENLAALNERRGVLGLRAICVPGL